VSDEMVTAVALMLMIVAVAVRRWPAWRTFQTTARQA
jgi:hypothetical protein